MATMFASLSAGACALVSGTGRETAVAVRTASTVMVPAASDGGITVAWPHALPSHVRNVMAA